MNDLRFQGNYTTRNGINCDPSACSVDGCQSKVLYKFADKGFCAQHKNEGCRVATQSNNKRLQRHILNTERVQMEYAREQQESTGKRKGGKWLNGIRASALHG